jgi:hypothetical protein
MNALEIVEEQVKSGAALETAQALASDGADRLAGLLVEVATAPVMRRRVSREAGRALETLAHAIEYLADEYVHNGRVGSVHDPELKAIQILKALNREIYFACPAVPTMWERWQKFVGATTH